MLRVQEQEERAAESLRNEGTDGARVVNLLALAREQHKQAHQRIGDLSPLREAHKTYQEIAADQGAHEHPDEAYMFATFAGIREALTHKSGDMPKGCFQCERPARWLYSGSLWIRHEGNRHYLVFTDASGHSMEYRIWFCPYCGKKF